MHTEPNKLDSRLLDKVAIVLSGTCMVHCLLLPIGITLFPILQGSLLEEQTFHALFMILVLPTSVIALSIGCRQHKDLRTILLGILGLVILTVVAFFGHDLVGFDGERILATAGGAILAFSHYRNFRLCGSDNCQHQSAD